MSTEPKAPPSDDDATREDAESIEAAERRVRNALTNLARGISEGRIPKDPTLCIRLCDDGFPKSEHDPRLKQLDWSDRQAFLIWALSALAITPREYLDHGSFFIENSARDDPTTLAQWLKIARIVRAAYYEVENANSEFLKKADAAARVALEQHDETYFFSARSVAFEHLRDDLAILLQLGLETKHIATCLWTSMSEAKYHEIARHIPDLDRATISKRKMLDKLNVAREKPRKDDFHEQAESMIRAWLRAMGCPEKIINGAFDPERHRDERELGLR